MLAPSMTLVVVVDAHGDRAVSIDRAIVQQRGERRQGVQGFGAEAGIDRELERAEIMPTPFCAG